jgi:hypothetical protein
MIPEDMVITFRARSESSNARDEGMEERSLGLPGLSQERQLTRDEYFELVESQIYHEDELIGQRLTWLMTSESFLFGFHNISSNTVIARGGSHLPVLGIAISVLIYVSILAAVINLSMLRRKLDGFVEFRADGRDWPVPNVTPSHWPIRYAGLLAPCLLPILFIVAWLVVLEPWLLSLV